ncbi:hypothetical protein [Hymenobacter sp. HDW8]|uniref:hypothetical protein n=1 Tax=Hymenobacter sp. HDW8 TaxID=2714932 RepID=UPI00140746D9|nr:hypothetical protein [Hymenobacter sp. HDW8]QIL74978.1 hypothetical protein G7064_03240 [Hymenobacter sp. HDW8]
MATKKGAVIPDDAVLEFTVRVHSSQFFDYTALTLPARKIYDFYDEPTKRVFRYKENIPVFSNLTGLARGAGASRALFLSQEIPALTPTDRVESLILSGRRWSSSPVISPARPPSRSAPRSPICRYTCTRAMYRLLCPRRA